MIGVPRLPASYLQQEEAPSTQIKNQAPHMEAEGGGGGRWRNRAGTALDALMNYLISPPHCGSMSGG